MKNFIRLSEIDNVVTVTAELDSGVEVEQVKTSGLVPCSHKIATAEIRQGEAVRKYSQIIGYASTDQYRFVDISAQPQAQPNQNLQSKMGS